MDYLPTLGHKDVVPETRVVGTASRLIQLTVLNSAGWRDLGFGYSKSVRAGPCGMPAGAAEPSGVVQYLTCMSRQSLNAVLSRFRFVEISWS